jgi:hypothetical protein
VVLVACVALGAGAAEAGPRAVVDAPSLSLGEVVGGERARADFPIRNAGDAPLHLRVAAHPPADAQADAVVGRGETGHVRVEIDTAGIAGPSRVPLRVSTDDPAAPAVDLDVRLDVRHYVVATPGRARYVFVRGAEPVTVPETLSALDGRSFRVREVRSPLAALRVVPPTGDARTAWTIGLTLDGDADVGALEGGVEVLLDHPRQRRLVIPVSGFVRPVLAVTPPALTLPHTTGPWQARLHVRSFAEAPLELRRATSDVVGLALSVEPLDPGRVWIVRVEGSGEADGGTLRLETSSPVQPTIEVAVRREASR